MIAGRCEIQIHCSTRYFGSASMLVGFLNSVHDPDKLCIIQFEGRILNYYLFRVGDCFSDYREHFQAGIWQVYSFEITISFYFYYKFYIEIVNNMILSIFELLRHLGTEKWHQGFHFPTVQHFKYFGYSTLFKHS